jgi:hypothetical protein
VTRKFSPFFSNQCAKKGRGGGGGSAIYNLFNINKVIRVELGECSKIFLIQLNLKIFIYFITYPKTHFYLTCFIKYTKNDFPLASCI